MKYLIRWACYFLRAQGKAPSAKSVQAFIKKNTGSEVLPEVALYYLNEFQRELEDEKPRSSCHERTCCSICDVCGKNSLWHTVSFIISLPNGHHFVSAEKLDLTKRASGGVSLPLASYNELARTRLLLGGFVKLCTCYQAQCSHVDCAPCLQCGCAVPRNPLNAVLEKEAYL